MAPLQSPYGLLPESHFCASSGVISYESTYRPLFYSPVSFLLEATREGFAEVGGA